MVARDSNSSIIGFIMDSNVPPGSVRTSTGTLSLQWAELLIEVSRQFATTLELDEVLGTVLSLTVRSVGAQKGSIFLLDSSGRVIRSILARGNLAPEVKQHAVARLMDKGFAGWAYRNKQADIIRDTEQDDRWHVFPDDTLVTRAAMVVPLIRREQVIGIVTMMHSEPDSFNSEQLTFLEAVAAQAASAVENAALYTRVNNERSTLRALIASVHDAILVTDRNDRIILANPAARTALALREDVLGKPYAEALNEPELVAFYDAASGSSQTMKEIELGDGRVFSCSLVQVNEVGQLLGMHDITTFRNLDNLKSEFVAHVAHDLKAPLSVMYGYVKFLAELPDMGADEKVFVEKIIDSIHRMRGLIDNILDLGRIEMGIESELEITTIGSVVKEAAQGMEGLAAEKRVTLATDIADGLPYINAAPVRLGQAVSNLIGNALKFTPEEGKVTVRAALQGGQVVVEVQDTGPGIPPAMQAKLFQKFSKLGQKATRQNEGHGLGLAIVKSVVEAHAGRVWVESHVGEGSTFAFSLPPYEVPPLP